jgi:hypothetical protein
MTPDWLTSTDADRWLARWLSGDDWHTEPCEREPWVVTEFNNIPEVKVIAQEEE